ncbi:hypothetical protein BZG36_01446 [Bifiguratus adelaidae]|uniref:Uncharacterized protein n=1 Tax=Bifiguratus adelaidae TaxID=1938954 RepID=A0A261Y503_9FUNG|nr:hypothetical protein BZG36_01446 [Bifiguratus adelaidae]
MRDNPQVVLAIGSLNDPLLVGHWCKRKKNLAFDTHVEETGKKYEEGSVGAQKLLEQLKDEAITAGAPLALHASRQVAHFLLESNEDTNMEDLADLTRLLCHELSFSRLQFLETFAYEFSITRMMQVMRSTRRLIHLLSGEVLLKDIVLCLNQRTELLEDMLLQAYSDAEIDWRERSIGEDILSSLLDLTVEYPPSSHFKNDPYMDPAGLGDRLFDVLESVLQFEAIPSFQEGLDIKSRGSRDMYMHVWRHIARLTSSPTISIEKLQQLVSDHVELACRRIARTDSDMADADISDDASGTQALLKAIIAVTNKDTVPPAWVTEIFQAMAGALKGAFPGDHGWSFLIHCMICLPSREVPEMVISLTKHIMIQSNEGGSNVQWQRLRREAFEESSYRKLALYLLLARIAIDADVLRMDYKQWFTIQLIDRSLDTFQTRRNVQLLIRALQDMCTFDDLRHVQAHYDVLSGIPSPELRNQCRRLLVTLRERISQLKDHT